MSISASVRPTPRGTIMRAEELELVEVAFNSMCPSGQDRVPLDELYKRFFAAAHPRVREGTMAPSAARDTLQHHFGSCAADHDNAVTFDEFVVYHDKLVDEAVYEQVSDVNAFVRDTIMGLWRLGDLLLPTGIRPAFPITECPVGAYATSLMSLVWVEQDKQTGTYLLKGVKDVVKPVFKRGDLPEDLQGLFAYAEELMGLNVQFLPASIFIKRWWDFVWEYEEGKYSGIEGVISTCVDLDTLPSAIRQFMLEHSDAVTKKTTFLPRVVGNNPTYKRSSTAYGYGVAEETAKIVDWKMRSMKGTAYGLQFRGLRGNYFGKMKGPIQCNAATGVNM